MNHGNTYGCNVIEGFFEGPTRTAKNRLISRFSLFKIYLPLGYISECSINLGKDGEICFCNYDGAEF
jgi:hypothetical protein